LNPGPADNRFRLSAHCANEPQRQAVACDRHCQTDGQTDRQSETDGRIMFLGQSESFQPLRLSAKLRDGGYSYRHALRTKNFENFINIQNSQFFCEL